MIPGCAFTRRLYAYTANDNLKPHHHIRVNAEMRDDLTMWLTFLQHPSVFCRPFLDFLKWIIADEIDMYSDASGKIGMGVLCGTSWMHARWNDSFLDRCKPNIEYLKLYGVTAAVLNGIHRFRNSKGHYIL